MIGIAAIVLLYVSIACVFAYVGHGFVKAWHDIEVRRLDKAKVEVADETVTKLTTDIEELKSKMNSLQVAKAFKR